MSTRHTWRLHLLCREADVGEVNQTLRERLGERFVGFVLQEATPGLWACSGQWTSEEAAALLDACAGLSVRVERGALLGAEEPGAVVVRRGEEKPADPTVARLTFAAAVDKWTQDKDKDTGGDERPSATEQQR